MKTRITLLFVSLSTFLQAVPDAESVEPSPPGRVVVPALPGKPVVETAKAAATLASVQEGGMAKGWVGFFSSGDHLAANGRIENLEPNRRYRLLVERPALPQPGQPASTSSDPKASRELGVLTSDAQGVITVNATLRDSTLADGPTTIVGCTVSLWREPAGTSESIQVAAGTVSAVSVLPATPPTPTPEGP